MKSLQDIYMSQVVQETIAARAMGRAAGAWAGAKQLGKNLVSDPAQRGDVKQAASSGKWGQMVNKFVTSVQKETQAFGKDYDQAIQQDPALAKMFEDLKALTASLQQMKA